MMHAPEERDPAERLSRHGGHAVPAERSADRHPGEERPPRIRRRLSARGGGARREPRDERRADRNPHRRHRRAGADPRRQDAGRCAGAPAASASRSRRPTSRPRAAASAMRTWSSPTARSIFRWRPRSIIWCCSTRLAVKPSWPLLKPGALVIADTRLCPELPDGQLSSLSFAAQPHRAGTGQRAGDEHRRARRAGRARAASATASGSNRRCARKRRAASSISTGCAEGGLCRHASRNSRSLSVRAAVRLGVNS